MCARTARSSTATRLLAAWITCLVVLAGVPGTALAADGPGPWSLWVSQVTNRELKAEIPFAIVFTVPPMIVITPFWLASEAVGLITGGD